MAYTGEVHSSDHSDILDVVKQVLAGSDPGDKIYIEIHGDTAECDGSDDSYFVEAHRWNEFDEDEVDESECNDCHVEGCDGYVGCAIADGVHENRADEDEDGAYYEQILLRKRKLKERMNDAITQASLSEEHTNKFIDFLDNLQISD